MITTGKVKLGTVLYETETPEDTQNNLYYDLALDHQNDMIGVFVGVLRNKNKPHEYTVVFRHIPDIVYDTLDAEETKVKLGDGRFLRWKHVVSGDIAIQYTPVTEVVEA